MALRSFADGALFAESAGGGPPAVVLLHGWRRDRHDFDRLVPLLDCPSLAFDLPGFGASPPPPEAWGAAGYAAAVARALDPPGGAGAGGPGGGGGPRPGDGGAGPPPGRVVVVGHSFGGRVAVCLAAGRPDLVSGLVITGAPLLRRAPGRRPPRAFRAGRALHRRGVISDARMERLRRRYGSADYRAAAGVMRQVLVRAVSESYEGELARLVCPVSLVWGADDSEAPVAVARDACAIAAECDLTVVDGAGHDLHRERPDLLAGAVAALADGAAR